MLECSLPQGPETKKYKVLGKSSTILLLAIEVQRYVQPNTTSVTCEAGGTVLARIQSFANGATISGVSRDGKLGI